MLIASPKSLTLPPSFFRTMHLSCSLGLDSTLAFPFFFSRVRLVFLLSLCICSRQLRSNIRVGMESGAGQDREHALLHGPSLESPVQQD